MATGCTKNYLAGCRAANRPLAYRLLSVCNLTVHEGHLKIFININLFGAEVDDLFRLSEYPGDLIGSLAFLDGGGRGRWSLFRCRLLRRVGCRLLLIRVSGRRSLLLASFVVGLCRIVLLNFKDFRDGLQHLIIGWRRAFGVNE